MQFAIGDELVYKGVKHTVIDQTPIMVKLSQDGREFWTKIENLKGRKS